MHCLHNTALAHTCKVASYEGAYNGQGTASAIQITCWPVCFYSQSDGEGEESEEESPQEKTHMQFIHSDGADQDTLDYRAQPGADFVFYLRDMESRAV